jgi:hypothetical protein
LSEILRELEDFKEFSIGWARRGARYEDPDKRRFVPTNCPRCIIVLSIDDDVLEKDSFAIQR